MSTVTLSLGLLFTASAALGATNASSAPAYFGNPAQDLEFFNVRHFGQTKRVLLPTLYVRVMQWSRPAAGTSMPGTTQPAPEIVSPVVLDHARAVASALYEDLTAQLRAAGWDVVTSAELGQNAAFKKLPQTAADRSLGVPVEEKEDGGSSTRHAIIAPAGMPVIQAGATGPIWAMKDVLRDFDAGAMIVTYTFDVVATADTATASPEGTSTTTEPNAMPGAASASATPAAAATLVSRLQLTSVAAEFYNAQLVGGWIRSRGPQTGTTAIGTLGLLADKPARGNAFSRAIGSLSGGRRKGALAFEPDDAAWHAEALAIGQAFNTTAIRTIAPYAPKS